MAARKPAPRGAGAAGARAATRETKSRRPDPIEYRGVELQLPERLPGSLLFDFAEMETDSVGAALHMLESLIGRQQYLVVRSKVLEDDVSFEEIEDEIIELLAKALRAFGIELGESSAS